MDEKEAALGLLRMRFISFIAGGLKGGYQFVLIVPNVYSV
jgi:hypothetical protein